MYSTFQITKKYLHYYLTASSGKGHGIHSPFVFDFIKNVLRDKKKYDCYHRIEKRRQALIADHQQINVEDLGAGSSLIKTNTRTVSDIAGSSLKPPKYAQLLFRMINYYHPQRIVELGTSLGITAAYLSSGNANAILYTLEGEKNIAQIARQGFEGLGLKNVELIEGDFTNTLPLLLAKLEKTDFTFIDGNHSKEPTLRYFEQLLDHSTSSAILVFDDIHWSASMEEAWAIIQQSPSVTLTLDLFFIGIVFLNPDFKIKQHFTIRF